MSCFYSFQCAFESGTWHSTDKFMALVEKNRAATVGLAYLELADAA
jgi:hypothetical protein